MLDQGHFNIRAIHKMAEPMETTLVCTWTIFVIYCHILGTAPLMPFCIPLCRRWWCPEKRLKKVPPQKLKLQEFEDIAQPIEACNGILVYLETWVARHGYKKDSKRRCSSFGRKRTQTNRICPTQPSSHQNGAELAYSLLENRHAAENCRHSSVQRETLWLLMMKSSVRN